MDWLPGCHPDWMLGVTIKIGFPLWLQTKQNDPHRVVESGQSTLPGLTAWSFVVIGFCAMLQCADTDVDRETQDMG